MNIFRLRHNLIFILTILIFIMSQSALANNKWVITFVFSNATGNSAHILKVNTNYGQGVRPYDKEGNALSAGQSPIIFEFDKQTGKNAAVSYTIGLYPADRGGWEHYCQFTLVGNGINGTGHLEPAVQKTLDMQGCKVIFRGSNNDIGQFGTAP